GLRHPSLVRIRWPDLLFTPLHRQDLKIVRIRFETSRDLPRLPGRLHAAGFPFLRLEQHRPQTKVGVHEEASHERLEVDGVDDVWPHLTVTPEGVVIVEVAEDLQTRVDDQPVIVGYIGTIGRQFCTYALAK